MEKFAQAVYDTMNGFLLPAFQVPQVENLFATGSACEENYGKMLSAYGRICERLGTGEEDDDCEIIIDSLLNIQQEMAIAMFRKGYEFGQNGCPAYLKTEK